MKKILVLLLTFFALNSTYSQIFDPIKWQTELEKIDEENYLLRFKANLDAGWYLYSQQDVGDEGPIPTEFVFLDSENGDFELIGTTTEPDGEPVFDPIFEMDIKKFKGNVVFEQQIKIINPALNDINAEVYFMVCDDEKCLPPDLLEFSFELNQNEVVNFGSEEFVNPVDWTGKLTKASEGVYTFVFDAEIEEGWSIYSHKMDPDLMGPLPTVIVLNETSQFEIIQDISETGSNIVSGFDKFFEMETIKLYKDGRFEITVKLLDDTKPITGFLEFMACDDEMCLPPTGLDFSFNPETGEFNFQGEGLKSDADAENKNGFGTPVHFEFDHSLANSNCDGTETEKEDSSNFWWVFIAGFLGGLLALLTPCVFPMVPLTVSFFTKSSTSKASGIKNAIIYGISIIVIYVILGLLITTIFGADALNLLSTNAWFNLAFAVLFIVFAISFFGFFEITLPTSWISSTDKASSQGGLLGIFFMAFTLSLVSFSCTGPIIGTLLVETAVGGGPVLFGRIPVGPLIGMLGFSFALALPFALFAAFPGWLNSMPKSGGWMNSIKVTLGFIEIALALKFLSIADMILGWKILPYELFLILWILCALGLLLYFLGLLKFPLDSPVKKITLTRSLLSISMLILIIYMAMGFRVSDQSNGFVTPNLLSGLAPPAGHSYIYPGKCPLNLNCIKDFQEGVAFAKSVNKPILLDFTGHGCVNCRRMEDQVWSDPEIYSIINDDYVLISLYVDERTPLDEPYTSALSGRQMRNIGNKWADFQAIHFNRNSQPYYVLISPEGSVLNQPVGYLPNKKDFKAFLNCGKERFLESQ
ncbi:protein-disulfide reductase DsbD family protein [Planktosalinus lacus]|uniref:Thiol:disulfide interchange protein n=1 Tax=Planktosalinus lacus TaxID=1526573 RepID=A0A8J2VC36_9FLAO|nr:thioredoxin family protein [Planktosalinus lacus]GGD97119.1 thiol:disulfide interchange protein [Planktosalinus lacus]